MKEGFPIHIYQPAFMQKSGVYNLRFQTQEEITRIKNRLARWFSIYFPEYKEVYGSLQAVSGMMILKTNPLPSDIKELGVEGVNKIWREAKLRGAGLKRAKTLVTAAEHSIGSWEAPDSARIELQNLLSDYNHYEERLSEILKKHRENFQRFHTLISCWGSKESV